MPRYKLTIEYHGEGLAGWQRQADAPSVQQHVEEALRQLESDAPSIQAAGRTDAGVHARGQVAHCDMTQDWEPYRLLRAVNHHLRPNRIAILNVETVAEDFSARFSALARHYIYRMITRPAPLAIEEGLAWRVAYPLDAAAMQEAANHLIGHHDFTTFRSVQCQSKSPVKTMDRIDVSLRPDGVEFYLCARSFLHNQVRSIVGTLERVGAGRWAPEDVRSALEAKYRAACGPVAPAHGLYLERVDYPDQSADSSAPDAS